MGEIGDKIRERDVLWGWLNGCVVRAKPDGKNADFGDVLLFMLFCEALLSKDQYLRLQQIFLDNRPVQTCPEVYGQRRALSMSSNELTCSKTGIAHSVLYPDNPRLITSNFRAYTSKNEHLSL
jgi:hypothetical protein